MKKIMILAKIFSNERYLEDFIKGNLYMNSVNYFKKSELNTDIARHDSYEGIELYGQPQNMIFELNGHQFNMNDVIAPITIYSHRNNSKNIFCMWSLSANEDETFFHKDIFIDEKNKEFGENIVVLTSPKLFLERVDNAIKNIGLGATRGLVNYYESEHKSFTDDKVLFNKLSKFSYQKEYRIAIDTNIENSPYELKIGDLSDICIKTTIQEFNENIKIKKEGWS